MLHQGRAMLFKIGCVTLDEERKCYIKIEKCFFKVEDATHQGRKCYIKAEK